MCRREALNALRSANGDRRAEDSCQNLEEMYSYAKAQTEAH